MSGSAPEHGGDLAWANAWFGGPPDGWVDLSTGINPLAYPLPQIAEGAWQRLPQDADLAALAAAAARCYGVIDPAAITAAGGSQAILQILPRLRPATDIAIVTPTYGEYARCWQAAGYGVIQVADLDTTPDAQFVILANPNNPDGRRVAPEVLLDLAQRLAARDGLLIVDEAFCDAVPELSVARHAGRDGLVVLRSFGKFFGLAGLRLGFALTPLPLARDLRQALGPWPVAGPALVIGTQALGDAAWIGWTRDRLRHQAARLEALLRQAGLAIVGATPQFCLAAHPRADALFEHLGQAGILTRAFADQPTWLRFGLPAAAAFTRLAAALAAWRPDAPRRDRND